MKTLRIGGCLLLTFCMQGLMAQEPMEMNLWSGEAPGARALEAAEQEDADGRISNIQTPTLTVYLPEGGPKPTAAVVICPGGGYSILSFEKEGREVARWLNSLGVAAAIVKNRVAPFTHPVPLLDGQRAMRMVRHHAGEWGIDPGRVGILGFSAGGHLASSVGTHFDGGDPNAIDPAERMSCRPDFMVLIYPVISMRDGITHGGSKQNLLGRDAPADLVELMSNELQVMKQTPPTFLAHSDDDGAVPSENSVLFYLALRKAGVPAAMHIYLKGGHGYGMREAAGFAAQDWPNRCKAWMEEQGMLTGSGGR